MKKKGIFIGATGQNVGKTTTCLGIVSGLQKQFSSLGFIKPVGQRHVKINDINVDKDVVLFKEHFHLQASWEDMSPVLIPSGFTKNYIDGTVSNNELKEKIISSYQKIEAANPFTIVEGTGHVGVGSIVGLNNAQVAKLLGLPMLIVVSAGLGSAIDELALNIGLCEQHQVPVAGIIVNRVQPSKRKMILDYLPKALQRWNVPLIGAIPFDSFLSTPTIGDFATLFAAPLLSGHKYHCRHFTDTRLVAGSLDSFHDEILPNQLIITPASREDIIRATLERHEKAQKEGTDLQGGLILTGRRAPSETTLELIQEHNIPTLYAPTTSYEVMAGITSFIAKTTKDDLPKVQEAIDLVEQHIDFSLFLPQIAP